MLGRFVRELHELRSRSVGHRVPLQKRDEKSREYGHVIYQSKRLVEVDPKDV